MELEDLLPRCVCTAKWAVRARLELRKLSSKQETEEIVLDVDTPRILQLRERLVRVETVKGRRCARGVNEKTSAGRSVPRCGVMYGGLSARTFSALWAAMNEARRRSGRRREFGPRGKLIRRRQRAD